MSMSRMISDDEWRRWRRRVAMIFHRCTRGVTMSVDALKLVARRPAPAPARLIVARKAIKLPPPTAAVAAAAATAAAAVAAT